MLLNCGQGSHLLHDRNVFVTLRRLNSCIAENASYDLSISSFRNAGRILEGVQARQEDGDLPEVPDRAPQHCHSEVTLLSQVYLGQTALVRQDDP